MTARKLARQTRLDAIAGEIRADIDSLERAWDTYLRIGRNLAEARSLFPGDREYGQWVAGQEFRASQQWLYRLRTLSAHEDEVRDLLTTAVVGGQPVPGVNRMLAQVAPTESLRAMRMTGITDIDEIGGTADGWNAMGEDDILDEIEAADQEAFDAEVDAAGKAWRAAFREGFRQDAQERQLFGLTRREIQDDDNMVVNFTRHAQRVAKALQMRDGLAKFSPEAAQFLLPVLADIVAVLEIRAATLQIVA